jgi:hypothetical protein
MEATKDTYMIVKKEMDELLFRIWLMDGKSTTTNTVMNFSTQEEEEKNKTNKPFISFNLDVPLTGPEKNNLEGMYQQAITILREAYGCLQKGGKVNFVSISKSGKTKVEQTINTAQELIEWIEGLEHFGMNTSKSKKIFFQALKSQ